MNNTDFKELVLLIFNQTLGIKTSHNELNGHYTDQFQTYQLGRDLNKIKNNEPFPDPGIYTSALNVFFNSNLDTCIDKTTRLLEQLISKGYIDYVDGPDLLTKIDKNTINIYQELILDVWNHYYGQYATNCIVPYRIPMKIINAIVDEYTKFRLPVGLDYYRQKVPDIIQLLQQKSADELFQSIKTEYIYFFKNVIDNESFYTLSHKEMRIFIDTLYAVSDILDKMHHKDSYRINLEVLNFINNIYGDDFSDCAAEDVRKIQGSLYAISIENSEESLIGNIKLTSNHNMVRIEDNYEPITKKQKLDMCSIAFRNLIDTNKRMKKLDDKLNDEYNYIDLLEKKLSKNRKISEEEINELYVLSHIYSNISTCALQYIKSEIGTNIEDYIDTCITYHERSGYIRNLIVRITNKKYGKESEEYREALYFLAGHYHSMATVYFYTKDYFKSIFIRSVLYHFYSHLGLNEKARVQLGLAPIKKYEADNGNASLYNKSAKSFMEKHKKNFSFLFYSEVESYESFKETINAYEMSKRFL